jgi:hypothetical protein
VSFLADLTDQDRPAVSLALVQLLAFKADPVALVPVVSTERGGHHGHAAARADRRALVVIHVVSIPGLLVGRVLAKANSLRAGPVFPE